MLSLYEILKASKTGIAPDKWTALAGANFGGAGSGAETKEITGIPPLSIRSNGTMLLDYLISGNMSQTGTPTPTTPIQPQECGERTGNLFDYVLYFQTIQPWSETSAGNYFDYGILHLSPNTTYTFSTNFHTGISGSQQNVRDVPFIAVDSNTNPSTAIGGFGDDGSVSVTTLSDGIIRLFKRIQRGSPSTDLADLPTLSDFQNGKWVMCNDGSTPLPYEPYGYKIPISSGGVNLFDKDNADIVDLYPDTTTREIKQSSNLSTWSIVLPVEPSTTYTFTMGEATTAIRHRVGMCSDYPTKGAYCTSVDDTPEYDHPNLGNIFTTDADTRYVLIMYVSGAGRDVAIERANRVQVVKGNTALPYEPYVQPTLSNIYLGEVETTRNIKKIVFSGTEPWVLSGTTIYINNTDTEKLSPLVCTHFPNVTNTGMWNSNNWIFQVDISRLGMSGREAWVTWLAEQYAAGTPVTIWYVLATPETAVVNEPLRKIGDYADTLSYEQAGVQIPTNRGNTVIDVDTTLKPSEMYIKYQE